MTQASDRQASGIAEHLPAGARCVAVISGKGGVGKSLVTGLLAVSFARRGHEVGILDADVTGPSIPRMFGVRGLAVGTGSQLAPARSHSLGIRIMSLNLLMENEDDPVVWRGPLVSKMVQEFVTQVDWDGIRYLFIDLPPGTSDVPLTIMQQFPLHGLIVVSSPQELVGMIVRKAVKMADTMGVPVLGLVQNMTHIVCPECGALIELFGEGHRANAATPPVLASIPVDPVLSSLCDTGGLESYAESPFDDLVDPIATALDGQGGKT